ncbi:MAG: S-layer homology domain-containing protein [Clostridia bacterium]|nr:S-layer homology domain-containing protein [Clostridia bacterium]
MKRIFAFILTATLIVGVLGISAFAAAEAKLSVNAPGALPKSGETFTVTVDISGNTAFYATKFTLSYNTAELACTDAVEGAVLEDKLVVLNPEGDGGAVVAAASDKGIKGDGALAVFTFKALKDVTDFGFSLTVSEFADENGGAMPFIIEGSKAVTPSEDPEKANGGKSDEDKPDPAKTDDTDDDPDKNGESEEDDITPAPDTQDESETAPAAVSFTDTKGHWGEQYIEKAVQAGLFKGYEDGSFGPDVPVSRAQYVTVLWRMAGTPAPGAQAPFEDIASQSEEFKNAISWAYEKGYVNGTSPDTFEPAASLTREAAMKILFGYAGAQSGMEVMFTGIYDDAFSDSADISAWAKDPMYWGVYKGIISGTGEGQLSPQGTATRAQLAKILVDFTEKN